jgi:hypothetical protein
MVGKCANPDCAAKFRYLREGRLFQIDMRHLPGKREGLCPFCGHPLHLRYFWLCDACAQTMTLTCTVDGSVKLVCGSIAGAQAISLACPSDVPGRAVQRQAEDGLQQTPGKEIPPAQEG